MFFQLRTVCTLAVSALFISSCSIPHTDVENKLNRDALIYDTNLALTRQDCAAALARIVPLYNSPYTDNTVRAIAASAYACNATLNIPQLAVDITSSSSSLSSNSLWSLIARLFPSTASDRVVESAGYGIDAIQAVLNPGIIVLPQHFVNAGSYNVGSRLVSDRTADANAYLFFLSLPVIGGIENRFGSPDPTTHVKTVNLPWTTADAAGMSTDGCAYASGIVNMIDGLSILATHVTGTFKSGLENMLAVFDPALKAACDIGCQNINPGGGWVASGCTVTTACSQCPSALRDRSQCTGALDDQTSCAAAGIVNFINSSPLGWN